jgi:hypothetical protein
MTIELPEYYQGYDINEKIDYLLSLKKKSEKPKKPPVPLDKCGTPVTADEYAAFAKRLKSYELEYAEWKNGKAEEVRQFNEEIEDLLEELVKEEAGLTTLNISDKQKRKLWERAWEENHSQGYLMVYQELDSLVELFED